MSPDKKKILVVDDDEVLLSIIADILAEKGFTIDCAHDGIECGVKLFENKYDAIIMDLYMPNMDGLKSIKYLRGGISEHNRNIKIIVVSGVITEQIGNRLDSMGIPYFSKPVQLEKLVEAIES